MKLKEILNELEEAKGNYKYSSEFDNDFDDDKIGHSRGYSRSIRRSIRKSISSDSRRIEMENDPFFRKRYELKQKKLEDERNEKMEKTRRKLNPELLKLFDKLRVEHPTWSSEDVLYWAEKDLENLRKK